MPLPCPPTPTNSLPTHAACAHPRGSTCTAPTWQAACRVSSIRADCPLRVGQGDRCHRGVVQRGERCRCIWGAGPAARDKGASWGGAKRRGGESSPYRRPTKALPASPPRLHTQMHSPQKIRRCVCWDGECHTACGHLLLALWGAVGQLIEVACMGGVQQRGVSGWVGRILCADN
jgi:hypothetical protein